MTGGSRPLGVNYPLLIWYVGHLAVTLKRISIGWFAPFLNFMIKNEKTFIQISNAMLCDALCIGGVWGNKGGN